MATIQSTIPESASAAALVHDGARILSASESAARLLGFTHAGELAGRLLSEIFAEGYSDDAGALADVTSGGSVSMETWLIRRDGSVFRAEMTTAARPYGKRTAIRTLIRELPGDTVPPVQQEYYRTLVEFTSAILWEGDPGTLDITYVSPEAEKLLGYPLERWGGEEGFWLAHVHPDDREWAGRFCAKAARDGRQHSFDYRMIAADGRTVWLRDVVNVIVENGRPVKLVGVMIDITESKNVEHALARLADLQRRMVEISQTFIAGRESVDERIHNALGMVAELIDVDRSYLFRFSEDLSSVSNTHEWCAEGIEPEIDHLQDIPSSAAPGMLGRYERQEVVHIPKVAALDDDWADDRDLLLSQGVQSVVGTPIVVDGTIYGFIGFDSVRELRVWSDEEIHMLRILGEMIGSRIQRDRAETALAGSEAMRSRAEVLANLGSWELDLRQGLFKPSPEWCRITGLPERGMTREEIIATVHPEDVERIDTVMQESLETGKPYRIEHRIYHQETGEIRWIRINSNVIHDNGEPSCIYGYAQDITEHRAAEASLAESEARYRSVVDNIREVVFQTDTRGYITFLNPAWSEITGYTVEESMGHHFLDYVHPADKAHIRAEIEPMIHGRSEHASYETRYQTAGAATRWVEVNVRLTRDAAGRVNGTTGTLRDITRQREAEQRMEHLARHDPLTDLPNRILAIDRIDQLIKAARHRGRCLSVLFVDLDHFKKVNDTKGHVIGDVVLQEAARRLQANIGDQDTVARLGGDEFMVLLADQRHPEESMRVVEGLLEDFRDPFPVDGRELVLTVSIGIAVFPDDGETAQDLMRNASTALNESKIAGRNTHHFFTAAMNEEVARRLALEEALRHAVASNEFTLVYQPVIDLADMSVVGAEALLRWHSSTLGAVSPAEFIPIAEQTDLIGEIGDFVLRTAMTRAAEWRRTYRETFHVSVNVSPRQFRDVTLAERIETLLHESGLPGEALEIEITEGVLLSGQARIGRTLNRLRKLGISIAMDDFGTGYASLSYLREYAFDTLKIDRSFVNGMTRDAQDRELVLTSLRLASGLQLRAVAEGVETSEQARLLSKHGCPYAQGYLFSRPVPPEEFPGTINLGATLGD